MSNRELSKKCGEVSKILKMLAHNERLQILCSLATGEKTVGELEDFCGASQSLVSQYLSRMRAEGLLEARRDGKSVFYCISNPEVMKLLQAMHKIFLG